MGGDQKKVIGDISEHRAIIKFLKEGYMVFKNVSGVGCVDMIILHKKTGEIRKIDVKTTSYRQSWKPGTRICRQRTKEQIRLGVEVEFLDKYENV